MDPGHELALGESLFPAIEQELDLFDLPANVDQLFEPVATTDTAAAGSGATATAGPVSLSSASLNQGSGFTGGAALPAPHLPSIVRAEPTRVVSPSCLVPFKDRKRPTHALPRAKLARWDFLWERLRGEAAGVDAVPPLAES